MILVATMLCLQCSAHTLLGSKFLLKPMESWLPVSAHAHWTCTTRLLVVEEGEWQKKCVKFVCDVGLHAQNTRTTFVQCPSKYTIVGVTRKWCGIYMDLRKEEDNKMELSCAKLRLNWACMLRLPLIIIWKLKIDLSSMGLLLYRCYKLSLADFQ